MSSQEEVYETKKKRRLLRAAKRKAQIWLYAVLLFLHIRPRWNDRDRREWR